MKSHCLRAVLATVFLAVPTSLLAQDLVAYDTVGVWEIYVDPTVGNGCLINAAFEDGSDVRIGFDRDAGTGYMIATNQSWGDIVDGETYPISMDVDGSVYNGQGNGIHLDDVPGVDIPFDSIDFLMDVASKQTLTLSSESGPVMSIDLTDTSAAIEAAIACQDHQG